MSDTTNLNLRLDKELKKQAEELFAGLGINMTTAINIFLRQAVREQGIPFQITAKKEDITSKVTISAANTPAPVAPQAPQPAAQVISAEVAVTPTITPTAEIHKKPEMNRYIASKLKEADLSAKIDPIRYTFDELTEVIRRRRAK